MYVLAEGGHGAFGPFAQARLEAMDLFLEDLRAGIMHRAAGMTSGGMS
jgi:hypothetical protein